MPIYKFNKNDVYINTLKTYPEINYFIHSGTSYYNNTPNISGSFTGSIRCTDPGSVSLFELNIDRKFLPSSSNPADDTYITSVFDTDSPFALQPDKSIRNTGLVYQFMAKDSTRIGFNGVSATTFDAGAPGTVFVGTLPYIARISREYYSASAPRYVAPVIAGNATDGLVIDSYGSVSHIRALKNVVNDYTYLSPYYEYSSSAASISGGIHNRSFDNNELSLISIPSIFYGSKIKPGTVKLDFYVTGNLVGRLEDKYRNGVLYQTAPAGSTGSGSVAGIALYTEGFFILTGSWTLSPHTEIYGSNYTNPNWINFASSLSGTVTAPSSSFLISMSGTSRTQTMTMFANAPKGLLNQSNNPTFVNFTTGSIASSGPQGYIQDQEFGIKNVVSSAYNSPTASFERTTYISKVGIYDKNMNLIAIAKSATPIRKTAERDFTFKIELDI